MIATNQLRQSDLQTLFPSPVINISSLFSSLKCPCTTLNKIYIIIKFIMLSIQHHRDFQYNTTTLE